MKNQILYQVRKDTLLKECENGTEDVTKEGRKSAAEQKESHYVSMDCQIKWNHNLKSDQFALEKNEVVKMSIRFSQSSILKMELTCIKLFKFSVETIIDQDFPK